MQLQVKKIHPNAIVPTKRDGNLAFDLHVVKDESFYEHNYPGQPNDFRYKLKVGQRKTFHTGLQIAIPKGYGCIIKDRSGLAVKYGIHVLAGVIDSSYRGEWCVCLINLQGDSLYWYEITEGDRIAQAIIVPDYELDFIEVDELSETWRGENGFGSSGK